MNRKVITRRRTRSTPLSSAIHIPHSSWARGPAEPRTAAQNLAPEEFWKRLGL